MINQEKVLRITKMASYEAKTGKKDKAAASYFRGDYIGMQMILSLVIVTVVFLAGLGAYVIFNFTEVMENVYSIDMVATAKHIIFLYAVVAGIYLAVTYAVYAVRYAKAKKRLNLYLEYLDCLEEGTDAIERG